MFLGLVPSFMAFLLALSKGAWAFHRIAIGIIAPQCDAKCPVSIMDRFRDKFAPAWRPDFVESECDRLFLLRRAKSRDLCQP